MSTDNSITDFNTPQIKIFGHSNPDGPEPYATTKINLYFLVVKIKKLISVVGSDKSIVSDLILTSEPGTQLAPITSNTIGPVTYTITGSSDSGIITSNSFTVTWKKPFTIPICSNIPGVLITLSSDELFTKYKKITNLNINNGKDYFSFLKLTQNFGLPQTMEGYAYSMVGGLLSQYGVSSSRICDAKITPDIIDMTDATNATLSFILTDRIIPDNNIPIHSSTNNSKSNDYLSCFCIAKWLEYDIKNTDKFMGIIMNMYNRDRLPLSLLSPSCPAFNSPSFEHYSGLSSPGPPIPDLGPNDVVITYTQAVSKNSQGTSSNSDNSIIIIIIIIVFVSLILFGGFSIYFLYFNTKPVESTITAGRFRIGE